MSAFLGPIHYWLFNKICLQDSMVESILDLNDEKKYVSDLRKMVDEECDSLEKKPLEEMIDEGNIHGWLQHKVNIVENRLSFVVTELLKKDSEAMEDILNVVYQLGTSKSEENTFETPEEVYQYLNDMLLDGMPCDHVNELVSVSDNELIYRRTMCIHQNFWKSKNGNPENYYTIRCNFIDGLLKHSYFEFKADAEGNYHIIKK